MLSQRDTKWAKTSLGFGTTTIGSHGCFLTCLSFLAGITPYVANDILKKALAFNGDLIISDKAAKALDLEYFPPSRSANFQPTHICIAEVDFSPSPGKQQHFVVYDPFKRVFLDPWIGGEVPLKTYKIISIRLFKMKENNFEKAVSSTAPYLKIEYGDKLNDNEVDDYVNKIKSIINQLEEKDGKIKQLETKIKQLEKKNAELDEANNGLAETCSIQKEQIDLLEDGLLGKVIFDKWGYLLIQK